jgi:hypothetical protein
MIEAKIISIKRILTSKAQWRRKLAVVYSDARNLAAAEFLERLAVEDVTADVVAKIESVDSNLNRAVAEVAHRCAFWHYPRYLGEFIDLVIEQASKHQAELDLVFSGKIGGAR